MKKLLSAVPLLVIILNTGNAQNVALPVEKKISWKLDAGQKQPLSTTYSVGRHKFGNLILPSVSESFPTSGKGEIVFSDFEYELLGGYTAFKQARLSQLKGETAPEVFHTMEGNKVFTGYHICPYKESGGNYYILKSFRYTVKEGPAFANAMAVSKRAATNSVLSSGQWLKFSVREDGIYKIDASLLASSGINLNSIDPRTIKIYGHQGGVLPEAIDVSRFADLPENAIRVVGEEDGTFNNGDYILFYAQSPHKWNYVASAGRFIHQNNIYSDKTYFFLTFGGTAGLRMNTESNGSSLTADGVYDWFDYMTFHDKDNESLCSEGRIVMGEKFDQTLVYNFNHNLANITNNKFLSVYFRGGALAPSSSKLTLRVNNGQGTDISFGPFDPNYSDCFSDGGVGVTSMPAPGSSVNLSFSYNKPNSSSKGWLDYYELHCTRKLIFNESFMTFQNIQSASVNVAEYRLSSLPSSYMLFDVTNPLAVKVQDVFNDNGDFVFRKQTGGKVGRYVLTDGNTLPPDFEGTVTNQNLHATGIVQFIIVSPPEFMEAANKLADFHRTRDNMSVLIVTPQQIYNEFSSGSQDISAIRDFFRLVYYNNTNPVNQLRYAMFLGDASFDYKDKIANNSNFVPTYESEPKWNINYSYFCTDDFFGYLDNGDGHLSEGFQEKLEIAVTRLPVSSPSEAMSLVNKIIHYKQPASLGEWRTFITFCADDADEAWEKDFIIDFEDMYRNIDTSFKNVNVRKVYFDAFKQQNLGGSQRYPEAQEAVKKEFEKGTLVFNYVGHGGEEYLAHEKVIDIPLINSLNNINNLPVFFTATCEFSRYDDGRRKSAGEYVITNPNGGSVAMFTTTRKVTAGDNAMLTKFFWSDCAFTKIGGKWPTLGDIYKKLKNRNSQSDNDINFTLFADPALTMNYPEHIIIIDSINHLHVNSQKDTIKALSKVTFSGHIEDVFGQRQNTFNGSILPTVYDKQSTFNTLSNDLPNEPLPFKLYSSILYKGENSVSNGLYSFSFVVPKDINYNYGFGKISMYAKNAAVNTDASGHFTDLVVGGSASNAPKDVAGPQVELFVDDYTFVSGGLTDNTPLLLARIFDENGVNTSGNGIGRDIVAIIDKGTPNEKKYILNTFYQAKLNSYTTGDLRYQLENLPAGLHTYTLKVWDVYNNSSESTIEFLIRNDEDFAINNLLNYPNPFSTNTTFHFDQNRSGENLHIVITILTISGKVLKTIEQTIPNAGGHVSDIQWNGRDDYDDKPSKGVYIYRLVVTTDDGKKAEKVQKLVILN